MSARLPDETGLEKELCPALAGLPAQVKVLASETDNVVSLEELALRFLHRIQRQPTGLSIGGPRVVKALFRKRACPLPPLLLPEMRRCWVVVTELLLGLDANPCGESERLELLKG